MPESPTLYDITRKGLKASVIFLVGFLVLWVLGKGISFVFGFDYGVLFELVLGFLLFGGIAIFVDIIIEYLNSPDNIEITDDNGDKETE